MLQTYAIFYTRFTSFQLVRRRLCLRVRFVQPLSIPAMPSETKIGFIGAGQMAEALARGFINQNMVEAGHVFCTDPVEARKEVFRSFGTVPVDGNIAVRRSTRRPCTCRPTLV